MPMRIRRLVPAAASRAVNINRHRIPPYHFAADQPQYITYIKRKVRKITSFVQALTCLLLLLVFPFLFD